MLAKVDVDKNQFIAAQFQVQSIPTVYAMFQGQLVADLTQRAHRIAAEDDARPDPRASCRSQSEAAALEAELEPLIAMGEQVLAEGDAERAIGIFRQIAEMAPEHPAVACRAGPRAGRRRAARRGRRASRQPADEETAKLARDRARARRADAGARCEAGRRPVGAGGRGRRQPGRSRQALRARRRADGGGRPRCRRGIAARDHRRRPRLERGRGAARSCSSCSRSSGWKTRGSRRSAASSPRSCSGERDRTPPVGLSAARRAAVPAACTCRCTSSSRATARW